MKFNWYRTKQKDFFISLKGVFSIRIEMTREGLREKKEEKKEQRWNCRVKFS